MIIGDGIVLGAGGESASIFVTGVAQTDAVTCTKDGKIYTGKWVTGEIFRPYSIPAMTSNTTPEGVASTSNEGDSAFKAFNGVEGNGNAWQTVYGVSPPQWVQYEFPNPVTISAVMLRNETDGSFSKDSQGYISISDNGIDFTVVKTFSGMAAGTLWTYILDKPVTAKYLRVTLTAHNNSYGGGNCRLSIVQVDGLVPETVYGFRFDVNKYGTYTVTATDGTKTVTQDVLVDAADVFSVEAEL